MERSLQKDNVSLGDDGNVVAAVALQGLDQSVVSLREGRSVLCANCKEQRGFEIK